MEGQVSSWARAVPEAIVNGCKMPRPLQKSLSFGWKSDGLQLTHVLQMKNPKPREEQMSYKKVLGFLVAECKQE